MAIPAELWCSDTFPPHLNPLHVLACKSQFSQLFNSSGHPVCVLAFSRRRTPCSRSDIFICVHLTAECESIADRDAPLKLHASRLFLRHYGFQNGARGRVRAISPIALSRVVLGARTKQSFRWVTSERFSSGLLVLASCETRATVARRGDALLLPCHPVFGADVAQVQQHFADVFVLDCAPVAQGLITTSTSVVVTDCRDVPWSGGAPEPCGGAHHPARPVTPVYASDFAHYARSLDGGPSLLQNTRLLSSPFSDFLRALECRLDVRVADVSGLGVGAGEERAPAADVHAAIFVRKQLLFKLGLFNGEWVSAAPLGPPAERAPCHLAAVLVHELGAEVPEHVALVSPALWFNVSGGEAVPVGGRALKIKRLIGSLSSAGTRLSESPSRSAAPPFAQELHIQVVVSPDYSCRGVFDDILSEHFTTPRLVQTGDLLCVPTKGHAEFLKSSSESFSRWPVLYFKVKKVSGKTAGDCSAPCGYLADAERTSLYTSSSHASSTSRLPAVLDKSLFLLGIINGALSAQVDCVSLCADTPAACEARMRATFSRAALHQPCVLLLRNLQLLGRQHDHVNEDSRVLTTLCLLVSSCPASVVVVGTVHSLLEVSLDASAAFVHQVAMENPMEEQRRAMLSNLCAGLPLGKDVSLGKMAKQTAGFLLSDLVALLTNAGKSAHRRLSKTCPAIRCQQRSTQALAGGCELFDIVKTILQLNINVAAVSCLCSFPTGMSLQEEEDLCVSGVSILSSDFSKALELLQAAHSQAIGAPKIPTVKWQDVGGLQQVKKEILDTIQLPLEHPELISLGLRRSGLLLYGPPGTGKTLLAKAVATECSMTFLSVKGPELLNMYVGQSEENVREVFSKARAASPCIIFFDELDSLAPNRGRSGDSGGVMDRVVSQLLAELDGLHSSVDVFVIGATNRPDLLDQSLLRPGRFDKLVYVGISEDKESQLQVLKAIVREFKLDPNVSLPDIVERCPPHLTGADMYALCSDAMTLAIKRKITHIQEGVDTESSPLTLSAEDFLLALERLRPSVSHQELLKYKLVQQKFTAN
ncbi:peroxisome assembly factor 2-like [Scleropages formosus]|uniref:Peroxisomal ATPase PEX6 n=1 Tax=Scleropages formosus TaxID=113540 RepID=A0A0P7Z316_SCLFO|nr:peroxisome assembly factor 2-like [Scleropages formosus]